MSWNDLSLPDKARMMQLAVKSGITDLRTIQEVYNKYAEGGPVEKQKAIINTNQETTYTPPANATFIKDLAYRIGADQSVSSRGYSGIGNVAAAMLHLNKVPLDDNKYAFLYGTGERFPVVDEPVQGFDFSNYLEKSYSKNKRDKIKNVYGIINPDEEYYIDSKYKGLVEELAKNKHHFYDNADELTLDTDIDNTKAGYRDDVANFVHQFGVDEGGNPVVHDADVYDFLPKDYNYGDESSLVRGLVRAEAGLFNSVGTPYIIRQEWQPVTFGDPTRFSQGINEYLENMTEEDIAKATGTGFIEPSYITDGGAPIKILRTQEESKGRRRGLGGELYSKGGRIYIKPKNRGKFTALKKRTGKSASWFKAHGTPAQRKMATFALNARKWKHGEGGYLGDTLLQIP